MTQKIQTTHKTMRNQTLQKLATLSNTVTRYSLFQTLMSNVFQYKASKGFRYIRYIYYSCRWWLRRGEGGRLRYIFGRFECGVLYCYFSLRSSFLGSPPDNYCTVPNEKPACKLNQVWCGVLWCGMVWFMEWNAIKISPCMRLPCLNFKLTSQKKGIYNSKNISDCKK